MKKILFITPYSGRAGAEVYLRTLLEGIDTTKYRCSVYCLNDKNAFFREMPRPFNFVVQKKTLWFHLKNLKDKLLHFFGWKKLKGKNASFFKELQKKERFDLWVINTILPCYVLKIAESLDVRCITIVHEGPHMYSQITKESFLDILNIPESIWTCSERVADHLRVMGAKQVEVLHPCIESSKKAPKKNLDDLKKSLGIADEFVCLCVGTTDPNKGVELVLSLAAACKELKIKFVWVGRLLNSGYSLYLAALAKQLGLTNIVFTGEQITNLADYFESADVLLLPSHYETFSLVALEALSMGKPVIAYEGAAYNQLLNVKNSVILKTRIPEEWKAAITSLQEGKKTFDAREIKESVSHFSAVNQQQALNAKLDNCFKPRSV